MNAVQTINQTSVAFMYETFGSELPVFLVKVIKVSMVLVPTIKSHEFIATSKKYLD